MKPVVPAVMIALCCFSCTSQSYRAHIDQSFFSTAPVLEGSLIADVTPESYFETTGIYCDSSVFLDEYAVVRVYDQGRRYIPLSTKLSCPDGMLINIKGKVIQRAKLYAAVKDSFIYHQLAPISFEIVFNSRWVLRAVSDEYQRIREKLQRDIAIEGSKLQLSPHPGWTIWYDRENERFIFHSHQADLMYAADIEFIFDIRTRKIRDVYARQWFKGEM